MNYKSLFTKQKMMRTVLLALIPVFLMSVYLFGWRTLMMFAIVSVVGAISEYLCARSMSGPKAKITEAVFVTTALFTLSLPLQTPIWVAVVGIIVAVVFGKMAFGGFGRNIFNPALVGRCFIYVAFPAHMTMGWLQPFTGFPGGFAAFAPPAALDAVSSVTPMIALEKTGAVASSLSLFLGNVAGSMGETSALLILLAGAYLLYTKVASWQTMVSTLVSGTVLGAILYFAGVSAAPPLFALLSGGFLFGAMFMATDPVSSPKDKTAQWIAGALIGCITVVIRTFSLFTEGMMFAILIVNAMTPLLDLKMKQWKARAKNKAKEATA